MGKQMFKKLMVLCVGLALSFSIIGCGDGAATVPEKIEAAPTEKPSDTSDNLEAPA
jgi:hypothetical protein